MLRLISRLRCSKQRAGQRNLPRLLCFLPPPILAACAPSHSALGADLPPIISSPGSPCVAVGRCAPTWPSRALTDAEPPFAADCKAVAPPLSHPSRCRRLSPHFSINEKEHPMPSNHLGDLNKQQRKAVLHGAKLLPSGPPPLLVIAGADSGDGGQAFHLKADSESGRSRTAIR